LVKSNVDYRLAFSFQARYTIEMGIDDDTYVRLLNALTEAALDTRDLDSMVQALADRMAAIIDADSCYISFWDAERGVVLPAAAYGPFRDSYHGFEFVRGEQSLTESIAMTGTTYTVENALDSKYISPRIASNLTIKSLLGTPIASDDKILGAVMLGFNVTHRFTTLEKTRIERAAKFASFAISKMRLLEEEKSRSEELAALNRIGMAINADRDFDQVISTIFEQCRSIIALDTFYLALYDEERQELRFPLFYDGGEKKHFETRSIREKPGISGHIIRTRASLSIPDATAPEVQSSFGFVRAGGVPSRAYIGVPLLYGDRVLGVISVQSRQPNVYTAHHVQLVETIAAQSAIAIENARLYGKVQLQSITDGLTGVYNFRHLMELGPIEFAKAARHERPIALLFFDIDFFRDFNSRYGHATGNEVLKAVADRVRSCIREIDLFARYGGEEFVVVLPETPPDETAIIAERVREAVETLRISSPAHDEALRVTISVGAASARPGLGGFQELLDDANSAERLAKSRGRNRVEIAE